MTPTHAVKSGRRYRYYVSRRLTAASMDGEQNERRRGWRLPAREIERPVAAGIAHLLANRAGLATAARDAGWSADSLPGLLAAARRWDGDAFRLIERVDLGAELVVLTLDLAPLGSGSGPSVRHEMPIRIKRRGVEMRLVVDAPNDDIVPARPDPALIKAVARAHRWFDDLATGRAASLGAIARAEGCTDRYVGQLMPLAFLAPDIVEPILTGRHPVGLTAEALIKRTDLPLSWHEQKTLLGVD